MKFWWANKVYNPQVTLAASLGFRIWQPLPMLIKLTKSGKQTSHIQAFIWSYITISAWELSILSLTSNQDIIGFPNQSKAFTNSKQTIWIFLIAGNVGSGWQLCMLRNFHWTFSLKWLYLKSELTMLHTCFLMIIYSTCTRCILTEFSFIYGVV